MRHSATWSAMLAFLGTLPVFGSNITVTNTLDSGAGSLRDAIANASLGDTISFSVTGTITLTSGELLIGQNLTITGPGAPNLSVSANNSSRVFEVSSAATVTISGLTISNGNVGGPAGGGGIFNNGGTLILTNSSVSGNSASTGGGIYALGGVTSIVNSTVSSDSAGSGFGGGISNNNGQMQMIYSTLSSNSAIRGGGIYNTNGGQLQVTYSTLSGNAASGFNAIGGGIWNTKNLPFGGVGALSTLTLTNSTLSNNSAPIGGGIYNGASTLNATFSTISGNSASSGGGGILNDSGTLVVQDTIVANNATGGNCFNGTTITSQGYNLSDDTSCISFFNQTGDLNNTPAGLDPTGLQSNGGPTRTIALVASSPAVNAIPGPCAVNTDQRGVTRLLACDIGAFEVIPDNDQGLAGLNTNNTFSGNQFVNGSVSANSFTGTFVGDGSALTRISPANISAGTAAINISGTAANATNAVNAGTALTAGNSANLGGITAGNYARLDIGNSFSGDQTVAGNLSAQNLIAGGTSTLLGPVTIGHGTPILQHLSTTFSPAFPSKLKPASCASVVVAFAGTNDGDTLAMGVSNTMMAVGPITFSAWISAPGLVTIQACNFAGSPLTLPTNPPPIRVDVWKH